MPLPTHLLENWTPEQAARMERAIFVAQHRLHTLELFDDEHLIDVLDRHPRADLGINTMGDDPTRRADWQEGRAGSLDAAELFEAARVGKVWLNVRRVMDHHPEYADVVRAVYADLERTCPGLSTFNHSANLLISSPGAQVYYHLDCPANMLWHIRGQKRVWAYPLEAGLVSDETIEGVLCGEKSEELDFRLEWDELAVAHDLEPGEMITWPQHTPHRVVNTDGPERVALDRAHDARGRAAEQRAPGQPPLPQALGRNLATHRNHRLAPGAEGVRNSRRAANPRDRPGGARWIQVPDHLRSRPGRAELRAPIELVG